MAKVTGSNPVEPISFQGVYTNGVRLADRSVWFHSTGGTRRFRFAPVDWRPRFDGSGLSPSGEGLFRIPGWVDWPTSPGPLWEAVPVASSWIVAAFRRRPPR